MKSDQQLVHLVAQVALGDRAAFKALYDQTAPNIMGLLRSMLRNEGLEEDLLQDTFIKVWHRAGDYHSERGRVTTWIASIARNAAIDALRAAKIRQGDDALVSSLPDETRDAFTQLASHADEALLHNCMGTLNEDQKHSIGLAFFAGYTHPELANQLGKPLGTVKAWVRRGLSKLKECLEK